MTIKGQITLPVEVRRRMKLQPGKKLRVQLDGDRIMISKTDSVEDVRRLLQAEMRQQGTGGAPYSSGDGWTAHVTEKYDADCKP